MDGRAINRVLIIGGRGALGRLAASAFGEAGWEVRSGVRGAATGEVEVDVDRAASVLAAFHENELVVNAVPNRELIAERLVLERGGTLINIAALPASAARGLRAEAGGARGTVLMNAGLAPGVTTIVAADLLRRHPDAEEIEMGFTVSSAAPGGPARVEWLRRGLTAVTRHRTAVVPLPEPFGERLCLGFGEDDAGWLGGIAEGRRVRPYLCVLEPPAHERLLTLHGTGELTRPAKSLIRAHRDGHAKTLGEPVAHWIAATRGDRRLAARTVRCRGDLVHAARSAVVFAEALRARPPGGGCFDPEEVCTLEDVRASLEGVGISIVPMT
jgi:hypothetical protein